MTVLAPPEDPPGAALDAQIAVVQALVNAASEPFVLAQYIEQLNHLQVEAVEHYMVTGWLNAATILETFQPPAGDKVGQILAARVTFLQDLVNNAPPPPEGNAGGYGGAGWTDPKNDYKQKLYAAQLALVQHIMDFGSTSAATILSEMAGFQSFPFQYVFTSVGYTDQWIET